MIALNSRQVFGVIFLVLSAIFGAIAYFDRKHP